MGILKKLNLVNTDNFSFILLVLFPIILITGNLLINFFFLIFSIVSIINFRENCKFYNTNFFYLLIIFFISLILSLLFSINFSNSYPRLIKFILVIFFISEINNYINKNSKINLVKIFKLWSFIFLIITIDIYFEFFIGHNFFGNQSDLRGRISSFFGDELVVGAFYHCFALYVLSFLIYNKYSISKIIIFAGVIIIASFIIGERSNFIKLFLSIFLFLFLIIKSNFTKKIGISLIFVFFLVLITFLNEGVKHRYYNQFKGAYSFNGIANYYKESQYGAHYSTAFQIFKNHVLFGVGLKNFRIESKKEEYRNTKFKKTDWRVATHPHQIHFEILSETGIIGYISFLMLVITTVISSIKNYLKYKNIYQLSALLYVVSSLIPFLPSGSIFSTFYGAIFWVNFALLIGFNNSKS